MSCPLCGGIRYTNPIINNDLFINSHEKEALYIYTFDWAFMQSV